MTDIAFIALGLGFLALCALYVRGLDHIVRSAHEAEGSAGSPADTTAPQPTEPALAGRA